MRADSEVIAIDRFIWFSGERRSVCHIAYRWLDAKLYVCATELESMNPGPSVSMAHESLRAAVLRAADAKDNEMIFIERWAGSSGEADELQEVYDTGLGFYSWRPFDPLEFSRIFKA